MSFRPPGRVDARQLAAANERGLEPASTSLAAGRWERLLLCLLGFVGARAVVNRLTLRAWPTHVAASAENRHAP